MLLTYGCVERRQLYYSIQHSAHSLLFFFGTQLTMLCLVAFVLFSLFPALAPVTKTNLVIHVILLLTSFSFLRFLTPPRREAIQM